MIPLKRFIVFSALCLTQSVVCGQYNVFFKAFDYNMQHNAGFAMKEHKGGILISGIVFGPDTWGNHLLNINQADTTLNWQNVIVLTKYGQDGRALVILDSTAYITGGFHDTATGYATLFLMSLNLRDGGLRSFTSIPFGFSDVSYEMTAINKDLIIAGTTLDSTLTNGDIFLMRVDTTGQIQFAQSYDYSPSEYISSLENTKEGGFIIGGEWANPATQNWDFFLLKVDSAGNVQWHKSYGTTNDERYGYAVTTKDGGYAIAGYRAYGQPTVTNINGLLIKLNAQGGVQWEKEYGTNGQADLFKILRQDTSGNFILAGGSRETSVSNTPRAWLVKTDPNGDTLWTRLYSYYGGDSHTYVEDMIQTSDRGYALTGYTIANVPTNNDLWVLKTDSLGRTCDSPPCQGVITGTNQRGLSGLQSVHIYPNPSNGHFTVDFPSPVKTETTLYFFNVQGVEVKRLILLPNTARQEIELDLAAGIYLYRITSSEGILCTDKMAVVK